MPLEAVNWSTLLKAKMEAQTLRLSEAQFRRPFTEFWSDYFRKNPEVPCVRCIPPGSWSPRNGRPYNLHNVNIDTPIKQHVSESCRCLLRTFPRVWGLLSASSPCRPCCTARSPASTTVSWWNSL